MASWWPVVLTPRPQESFAGYVYRAASFNGVDPRRVIKRLGLHHTDHGGTQLHLPVLWYGYAISSALEKQAARALGLEPEQVAAMHLARQIPDLSPDDVHVVPDRDGHRAARMAFGISLGTRICRWCFDEDRVVQQRWQLAPEFGCLRHRCLLLTQCQCGPIPAWPLGKQEHPRAPCWEAAQPSLPAHQVGGLDAAPETLRALEEWRRRLDDGLDHRPTPVCRDVGRKLAQAWKRFDASRSGRAGRQLSDRVQARVDALGLPLPTSLLQDGGHPEPVSVHQAALLPEVLLEFPD